MMAPQGAALRLDVRPPLIYAERGDPAGTGSIVPTLRPARDEEALDVLRWRNQERVRRAMLTQDVIAEDVHLRWWSKAFVDPKRRMFILEKDGERLAVEIYFDVEPGRSAWWAFYFTDCAPIDLNKMFRLWSWVETAGVVYAFEHLAVERLLCEVRLDNPAVMGWHTRFGFVDLPRLESDTDPRLEVAVKGLERSRYQELSTRGAFKERVAIILDDRDRSAVAERTRPIR